MKIFREHAPKLAFVAVAAGCAAGLVAQDAYLKASAPPELPSEIARIHTELKRQPSTGYPYGERAIAVLDFTANGGRLDLRALNTIAQNVVYPAPARPAVSGTALNEPQLVEEHAALGSATLISISAEPGRNVLVFEWPAIKLMKLLRLEIFRDENPTSRASSTSPYATVKFGENPETATGSADSIDALPRTPQIFEDMAVKARTLYTYRIRAVGRMDVLPEKRSLITNANGDAALRVVHAPLNAQRLDSATWEYAGGFSDPATVKSASNCDVRFSGLIGDISPEGVPQERRRSDYQATFAVRVWAHGEWKTATLQIAPGERLKGMVLMRNPESKRMEAVDFDTGLELTEVKWGRIRHSISVGEPQLDTAGDPKIDRTGRPVLEVRDKDGDSIPNETAVLRDVSAESTIEIPKAGVASKKPNSRLRLRALPLK